MTDSNYFLDDTSMPRQDLGLKSPWMNSAGMLGFAQPQEWNWDEAPGAFITNPVSLAPRSPATNRELILFSGGVLLHSGLPNPGFRRVLKDHAQRWARSTCPTWLHLLADAPAEIERMVKALENVEGVAAVEIGLPHHSSRELAFALVQSAIGELPVVANIPLNLASSIWIEQLAKLGLSAISLGPPRGRLAGRDGQAVSGRLYGPALFPLIFQAVRDLHGLAIPLIAGGGVFNKEDGNRLLEAGAWAVQLDTVLWM